MKNRLYLNISMLCSIFCNNETSEIKSNKKVAESFLSINFNQIPELEKTKLIKFIFANIKRFKKLEPTSPSECWFRNHNSNESLNIFYTHLNNFYAQRAKEIFDSMENSTKQLASRLENTDFNDQIIICCKLYKKLENKKIKSELTNPFEAFDYQEFETLLV